jgi:hypothetical protein
MKIKACSNSRTPLRLGRNLTLLLGIWICTAISRPAAGEEVSIFSTARENETVSWRVDVATVAATPGWDGSGKCPFDLAVLQEKATQRLAADYPDDAPISKLQSVTMHRVGGSSKNESLLKDKWYFRFTFRPEVKKLTLLHVVMLTDGVALKPAVTVR